MKKYLTTILLIISVSGIAQNIPVSGFDTTTGRPGKKYTLKPLRFASPLFAANDSTAAIDTSRFTIGTLNGTSDSIILTMKSGLRFAASVPSGGGSMAIGGAVTAATAGSVFFAGTGGKLQQSNSGLFFDSTNKRLGINTATPQVGVESVVTGGAALYLRHTTMASYVALRLLNDINSASRSLDINYTGSTSPPGFVTGALAAEGGYIGTSGAFPLTLHTNNTSRIVIDNAGLVSIATASPISGYNLTVGAGGASNAIGAIAISGGSTGYSYTGYAMNGALKALFGITGATNGLIANSVQNDFCVRNAQKILFSADAGTTAHMVLSTTGQLGIGQSTPTALLHFKAGTATASTAPLKFTSGTNLTTAEAGAMEYDGTNLFFSPSTTRYTVALSLTGSATLDFPSTLLTAVSDLTITITGAADGDVVQLGVPNGSVTATATYTAWVSATNTVTVRFSPKATEDPASGTFKVRVVKP